MANVRIFYNRNLKLSPGKLAAQAVHAALKAYGIQHESVFVLQGSKTKVESMDAVIQDAGLTEVKPGTITAGASLESDDEFPNYTSTYLYSLKVKISKSHTLLLPQLISESDSLSEKEILNFKPTFSYSIVKQHILAYPEETIAEIL